MLWKPFKETEVRRKMASVHVCYACFDVICVMCECISLGAQQNMSFSLVVVVVVAVAAAAA